MKEINSPTRRPLPLAGIQWRGTLGEALFIEGYRCFLKRGVLYVRKPDKKTLYEVNPVLNSCTCPAGQNGRNCKHRRGLVDLVFLSATLLEQKEGRTEEEEQGFRRRALALLQWWGDYVTGCGIRAN